ncbi:MAG: sigma-54-dependent transcriptional regulator [Victivallaceae bacterium]|nr:sigma-54 dependent transcriptional regulator [Victivallaceae bacterium]
MADKPTMLLADDERSTRDALERYLRRDYDVTLAEDGRVALNLLARRNFDFVLTDLKMPGADGRAVIESAQKLDPVPTCLVFSAYGTVESAVEVMKLGAFDFVEKPVNLNHLDMVLKRAREARNLTQENRQLRQKLADNRGVDMVAASPAMAGILDLIKQIAPSRSTVLLTGESGTGKEVAANLIHKLSGRTGPFVAVHCAALPATLLESELFGHEKGAFTGAIEQKKGRFELANDGTLFLDEIGEIDPQVQVKLLRVLETREFERLGGGEPLYSSARLVAATNRDLRKMVRDGKFREDLFYRLDVVTIDLPPLRKRVEDIPILVKRFLDHFAAENGRGTMNIAPDALEALCRYRWPGNIRELRNAVERMVVLCRTDTLTVSDLPAAVRENAGPEPAALPGETIDDHEKALIERALREANGNRTVAARKLGIPRRTFYRRLEKYGL